MGECPKDVVVPVIFLPGIMGSRLKSQGRTIWDPDDSLLMLRSYGGNSGSFVGPDPFGGREKKKVREAAVARKQLLIGGAIFDKDYMEPMEFSDHSKISDVSTGYWGSQVARNWGSVSWSSYGVFLRKLEMEFVHTIGVAVRQSNPQFNLVEMPVFALGYNWSASNDDSGAYAADMINTWVNRAKYHAAEIGAQCPGAILVTHSMGGLVARSATEIHGAADNVFAVLHTVMPTDGAAAAYKRFHFGFENPDFSIWSPISGTIETAGYVVLGRQGALVTAILGHMPGGQELLPNKRYRDNSGRSRWLTIHNPERSRLGRWISGDDPYLELPDSNPYTEIYRREDRMYRAANPDWLFPEGTDALPENAIPFEFFAEANEDAESFHDRLQDSGTSFHEITFLCYSDDASLKTYDRIDWKTDKPFGSLGRSVSDDNVAADRTSDYRREHLVWGAEEDKEISGGWFGTDFKIDPASGAGDMTVPSSSGKHVVAARSRTTGHNPGYMHEPALKSAIVQSWVKDTMVSVLSECSLY